MTGSSSNNNSSPYSDAVQLQRQIAGDVIDWDDFGEIENICAVDVAYDDRNAYCSAVTMSRSGDFIESADSASEIAYPYVPGLMMLREAPPIFQTLELLREGYDLLLLDGHGRLHPRRCGIACYVGVKLSRPAIGVAKSLLCGNARKDGSIELGGEILGQSIEIGGGTKRMKKTKTKNKKLLYVSVGHRISLPTAASIVRELGKGSMPEALRRADANSKSQKKKKGSLPRI